MPPGIFLELVVNIAPSRFESSKHTVSPPLDNPPVRSAWIGTNPIGVCWGHAKSFSGREFMYRLVIAISLLSAPAFAQSNDAVRDCAAIGQTAKGEMVYSLDCKAIKAENADANYKPKMPSTSMSETVIPKSGGTQKPAETTTTGVNK
jgi:hypothetical protein